jgi:hypothetical protein
VAVTYTDGWVTCAEDKIRVRGYYFPWGTKRIPYARIRAVRRVRLSAGRGRGRIWGTANPRYWASLDWKRPTKHLALVLDLGRRVHPFLTPEDSDAALEVIRRHVAVDVTDDDAPGPFI